jgi:hypothetical protein
MGAAIETIPRRVSSRSTLNPRSAVARRSRSSAPGVARVRGVRRWRPACTRSRTNRGELLARSALPTPVQCDGSRPPTTDAVAADRWPVTPSENRRRPRRIP